MFRTADLLKKTRLEKGLELEDISKKLKIPLKHLLAIEEENINCFPQEPYCSLIVKDYAELIGLNGQEIIRLFHRDFAVKKSPKSQNKKFFAFTPQFTFTLLTIICLCIFCSYLILEYVKFNRPPKITVDWSISPDTSQSVLQISGTTDPESTVRINQDLIIVDISGKFNKKLDLSPGENKITIESKSPAGKSTIIEKTFNFKQ